MLRTARLPSPRLSLPTCLSRRAYSASASHDAEAFLKPAGPSHPGVTYLSLNRPKTKNAISVNLLQVLALPTSKDTITKNPTGVAIPGLPRAGPVRQGVSPHSPKIPPHTPNPPRETLDPVLHQHPRPHHKLDVRECLLLRSRLDRTEINDPTSSR